METFPAISTSNALIVSEADCSTFSRKREAGGGGADTVKERQTQKGRCPEGFGQRPEGKGGASIGGGRPPQGGAGGKARALIGDDGALRQTPARQRANMLPRYTKRARKTGLPAQIRHMKAGRSEHRLRPRRD